MDSKNDAPYLSTTVLAVSSSDCYEKMMHQKHYSKFLEAQKGIQHFAAHSHHYWPDVTLQAMIDYWMDSAKAVDHKWDFVFSKYVPEVQKLIAENLNLSKPENITFAPNTQELLFRLISSLDWNSSKKIKILTTDSEFYSFERQIRRLMELPQFEISFVPTQPFASFTERFLGEMKKENWDLVFFSRVFFNSGVVFKDYAEVAKHAPSSALLVMDDYHGFMAVPADLSPVESRLFYISGGYKYAQGGEGCCFMASPPNELRPINTGWFADAGNLSKFGEKLIYSKDGYRFAGSTMDYTAIYRLKASLQLFKNENLSVEKIHQHVQKVQQSFLEGLSKIGNSPLKMENLISCDLENHGHFYSFELPSTEAATEMTKKLFERKVICDSRKNRIRFGFGIYHEASQLDLTAFKNL